MPKKMRANSVVRRAMWSVGAACAFLIGGMPSISHAVNYTWDASGGSPLNDGGGTWASSGGTNWFNGTTYGAWGNTTNDVAFFGVSNGAAGTITVSGSVATNGMTFNNVGSGNYTLSGGTIGFGGTTPTITANATGTSSIGSLLSSGSLTKSGAGTLAISGSGSTITGALTQTAGGIINTGSFNSGGLVITSGSFLNQNRIRQTAAAFEVNGASASFDNTGVITGVGGNFLVRLGSLTNSGTITGVTGVFGVGTGAVPIDTSRSAPATLINLASGSMNMGGGNIGREYWGVLTNAGHLSMTGVNIGRANSGVTVAGTSAVTITSGTISTTGGAIVLRLNTNVSNSTVQMNLNGGVWTTNQPGVAVDNSGNSGTNNRFEVNFDGGTYRTSNSVGVTIMPATLTAVTLNTGGGTLDIGTLSTGTNIIAANIIGVGGLTKTGSGTLSLSGSNTFAGTTRIVAGSLSIGNANALQNSTLDLATADAGTVSAISQNSTLGGLSGSRNLDMLTRTLSIGNNNASTLYSGVLSNGALTKVGSGTLTLTGANTYAGLTSVAAGTLRMNGLLGVGGVSVASDAILAGSGTIGGPVSILTGGIVGPGNSPGTLTVNDAFSLAGSSILSFELNAADTTVGSGINDLITGVTNLTLGGFLDITGSGDWTTLSPGASWRLFDYSGTLTDNGLTIRTAPALAAGQSLQISTATANQVNVIVVPEPGALALAGLGAALAGWMTIRRRR